MVKGFINTLCPLCQCALLLSQATAAKIPNPRFVTSHQASAQAARAQPAAAEKCHLPIDVPRQKGGRVLEDRCGVCLLTVQDEVSFNDTEVCLLGDRDCLNFFQSMGKC